MGGGIGGWRGGMEIIEELGKIKQMKIFYKCYRM